MESPREEALLRLADLTQAGAVRAAAAFAQLAGEVVTTAHPVVCDGESRAVRGVESDALGSDGERATGVFFEFDGCVDALVGILFPAAGCERLVRSVVGIESGALDPTIVESALMEVGNILASHVASGIADVLRSRLLPSIPALVQGRAVAEFEAWVEGVVGEATPRITVDFRLASGELAGRLVVVPTEAASEVGPGSKRQAGPV